MVFGSPANTSVAEIEGSVAYLLLVLDQRRDTYNSAPRKAATLLADHFHIEVRYIRILPTNMEQ